LPWRSLNTATGNLSQMRDTFAILIIEAILFLAEMEVYLLFAAWIFLSCWFWRNGGWLDIVHK
jgi:hypothetical protein